MSDFDPSLDDIVSAYVDGEATPAERARVESDPVLVERAATFRSLHEAVAAPDAPATDDLRNRLISRALTDAAPTVATVHTLRRSRRATALGPIVAAAAVIAMFFGLATLLVASQDNGDQSSETAAVSVPDADSFDAHSGLRAPQEAARTTVAASGATRPTAQSAKATPSDLGAFADEASLRQALLIARDGGGRTTTSTTLSGRAAAATDSTLCGRNDPADATVYVAELRGRPVTVVVSGTRADVYDAVTCQLTMLELLSR